MNKILAIFGVFFCLNSLALPGNFVYLKEIDASILQDIRYAGSHNFIGRPVKGYGRGTCILTRQAAFALKKVQAELKPMGLSLKVYDCYRPVTAVVDFMQWSKNPRDNRMQPEFYPRLDKQQLFHLGYIAEHSGHSRGSTVDLTIVNLTYQHQANYSPWQKLVPCYAPVAQRFHDNSIDMGSGFDCMDRFAHTDCVEISDRARANRIFLQRIMIKNGFEPYEQEWWHFRLQNETYSKHCFNFPVA